jgi:hypothetical protein
VRSLAAPASHCARAVPTRPSLAAAAASGIRLHGSQQTRSPLCNWFANEAGLAITMVPPRPSNHPFGQVPFLTDDEGVEIFESGARARAPAPSPAESTAGARRRSGQRESLTPSRTCASAGAILLYLADKAAPTATPAARAKYTKWVMWANSELDGLCFGAVPGDHRVRGTSLDKKGNARARTLPRILVLN